MDKRKPKWVKLWMDAFCDIIDPVFVRSEYDAKEQQELFADLGKVFVNMLLYHEKNYSLDDYENDFFKLKTRTGQRTQKRFLQCISESMIEFESFSEKGKKGASVRWGTSEQNNDNILDQEQNVISEDDMDSLKFLLSDYGAITIIDSETIKTASDKKFKWKDVLKHWKEDYRYNPEKDAFL